MINFAKRKRISFALLLASSALYAATPSHAEEKKTSKNLKASSVAALKYSKMSKSKNFETAKKMGFTMNGYEDVYGLRRIIGDHYQRFSLDRVKPADELEELAKRFGVDFGAINELDDFMRSGLGALERVEFVPGWNEADEAGRIIMPGDDMNYSPGDFGPSWPSAASLVGYVTSNTTRRDRGGYLQHITFSDGSWLTRGSYTDNDGNKVFHVVVTGKDGSAIVVRRFVTDKEGNPVMQHSRTHPSPDQESEAGQWYEGWQQAEREQEQEARDNPNVVAEKPTGAAPDKPEKPTEGKIDKFQPADGAEGRILPADH